MHQVTIIGGGFAGIKTALELVRRRTPDTAVRIISTSAHFEYHARLYRVLSGHSPLEVCIPLSDIFKGSFVEIVTDSITEIHRANRIVRGASGKEYAYDTLVVCPGAQTNYYDTPGLAELSYSINSIRRVHELKRHLHEIFASCQSMNPEDKVCSAHIVVVGGGATGVETAGELARYTRKLAIHHGFDPSYVTIDLIHSRSRLLQELPEQVSEAVATRLRTLGVNIFMNRRVMKEEIEEVYLKDMEMKTKTLIWCAGLAPHKLVADSDEFVRDETGRVAVNEYLQLPTDNSVYVLGDCAAGKFSGMAQTAIHQGDYAASVIDASIREKQGRPYVPKRPFYLIPVGPGWASFTYGSFCFHGSIPWMLRALADLRFFLSILPIGKAWTAFSSDRVLWETCPECSTL